MIEGIIVDNTPYVRIKLIGRELDHYEWFILDTGFTGELHIPNHLVHKLELKLSTSSSFIMGNGKWGKFITSKVVASLVNDSRKLDVIISEGSALAGVGFLYKFGYRAILDGKYKTINLEKA